MRVNDLGRLRLQFVAKWEPPTGQRHAIMEEKLTELWGGQDFFCCHGLAIDDALAMEEEERHGVVFVVVVVGR